MSVSAQSFEVTADAYDPDYHWGGISIYPEGPIPTQVQYPGLPAGTTLPPALPIHLDYFVTPAPPHLAHIPLECPGAPRPDRKPVKPSQDSKPKRQMGIYGPTPRLPSSRPRFIYAYSCEGGRWDHLPEHARPVETNSSAQAGSSVASWESYEREAEPVELHVSRLGPDRASDAHLNRALQNFRVQFGELQAGSSALGAIGDMW
ncbi:unnamed protein product [Rhizoctonia solani]|uniref:Uncharacterized protein n=1 Tax=Rhizoctonia solani TaxID=456999 RepID=A0A8H3HN00_9AGAM|nr:unnamed protein product [Rhizoctonia solani]